MIDFHAHILPQVDDGPNNVYQSLAMLRRSFLQGVDTVVSTSHFYGDQEYPREFLRRRNEAYQTLQDAMLMSPLVFPQVILGAEVLYFPGISQAREVTELMIGNSGAILVEPPMTPWTDEMLYEIQAMGRNFDCVPVIAHVDRFMRYLQDDTLMDRVLERKMLVQVNADFFIHPETAAAAVRHLRNGHIHLIGSDCHNMSSRPPNLDLARKQARVFGAEREFKILCRNGEKLLCKGEFQ